MIFVFNYMKVTRKCVSTMSDDYETSMTGAQHIEKIVYFVYRITCRAMIASGSLTNTPSSSEIDVTRRSLGSQDFPSWIATVQEIITRYGEDVHDVECLSAHAGFW